MLVVRMENGIAVEARELGAVASADLPKWASRWDWPSMEAAEKVSAELNERVPGYSERRYIAVDSGQGVSPRYDVILAPMVGEAISYAYNGDYYPDGIIVSVSKSLRLVVSSNGNRYYRRGLSGAWVKDGMWSLVHGHRDERNPHL